MGAAAHSDHGRAICEALLLVELEVAHCSVCGKPFATKRELEYDAERLGWSHKYMNKCSECRKQRSAAALASETVVAAARA